MKACKITPGGVDKDGYRIVWCPTRKKNIRESRQTYCATNGIELEDIAGQVIRHTCDNRPCSEPSHLILGTHNDNMLDLVERGGKEHLRVLTQEQADEVRSLYQYGVVGYGLCALARRFGCSTGTVRNIVHNMAYVRVGKLMLDA